MNTARTVRRPRALLTLVTTALLAVGALLAPTAAMAAPSESTLTDATLDWGVKSSFVGYVKSPIAHGQVQTRGSATDGFHWSGGSGSAAGDLSSAAVEFGAGDGVAFTGHAMNGVNALDLTFTHPQLVVSGGSATLLLDVSGREFKSMTEPGAEFTLSAVEFATVALGSPVVSGTTYTWQNAPVTLTAAGAEAFGGFYGAGTALDPLTLTATVTTPAAPTATTLTASDATIDHGADVALTATVTPAAAGSVTFRDGESVLGVAPVAGGSASYVASGLSAGAHSVTASFAPDDAAAFQASSSAPVTVTVTGPTRPEPGTFTPAVQVFLADGVTPVGQSPIYTGDELVVKGTGFDPAANVGGRGVPVPAHLPQGDYVVFGSFASDWQPSQGVASGARKIATQGWALTADVVGAIPAAYQSTVRAQWIELAADGSFTWRTTVKPVETTVAGGAYGVYTYAAGGQLNAGQEIGVPINFQGERPVQPHPEPKGEIVTTDGGAVRQGDTVTFRVTGLQAGETVRFEVHSGAVDAGTAVADADGVARAPWTVPADFATGTHELRAFRVPATGDAALLAVPFTVESRAVVVIPPVVTPPTPASPEPLPVCVARVVDGGSLDWGLKQSFRSYIAGPIAKGSFTGGSFRASSGALNADSGVRGRISFTGAITATGHNGLLNFRLADPEIVLNGSGTAALYARVSSTDTTGKAATSGTVHFADLSVGGLRASNGVVAVQGAGATLTAAGAVAFAGFYEAGTALDAVSFEVSLGAQTPCDVSTDPTGAASGGSLATTGADAPIATIALSVAMLVGGLALVALRRRRAA